MENHDPRTVDPSGKTSPPGRDWQQRYGALIIMAVFALLLIATVLFEVFTS